MGVPAKICISIISKDTFKTLLFKNQNLEAPRVPIPGSWLARILLEVHELKECTLSDLCFIAQLGALVVSTLSRITLYTMYGAP